MTNERQALKKAFDLITREALKFRADIDGYKVNPRTYRAIRLHLMNGVQYDAIKPAIMPAPLLALWLEEWELDEHEPTGMAEVYFYNLIEARNAEMIIDNIVTFQDWLKEWIIEREKTACNVDEKPIANGAAFTVSAFTPCAVSICVSV